MYQAVQNNVTPLYKDITTRSLFSVSELKPKLLTCKTELPNESLLTVNIFVTSLVVVEKSRLEHD